MIWFWLTGWMFSIGYIGEKEPLDIWAILMLLFCWPILLGTYMNP
jgi:hypothetical protein